MFIFQKIFRKKYSLYICYLFLFYFFRGTLFFCITVLLLSQPGVTAIFIAIFSFLALLASLSPTIFTTLNAMPDAISCLPETFIIFYCPLSSLNPSHSLAPPVTPFCYNGFIIYYLNDYKKAELKSQFIWQQSKTCLLNSEVTRKIQIIYSVSWKGKRGDSVEFRKCLRSWCTMLILTLLSYTCEKRVIYSDYLKQIGRFHH